MAAPAPSVAAISALRIKSQVLLSKGHNERHAIYVERTLAAARALGAQHCLITVRALLDLVPCRLFSARTCGDLSVMHALRKDAAELLLCAGAAVQARRVAGTLLPGACRPYEVEYEEACLVACVPHLAANPGAISTFKAQVGRFFGYGAFLLAAARAAEFQMFCSIGAVSLTAAQRDELWDLLIDGLDLMAASATTGPATVAAGYPEASLVNNAQQLFRDGCVPTSGAGARVRDAWHRLERSGVLVSHNMGCAVGRTHSLASEHERLSQAATAAPGLRSCALPGCGARERHPSHFKTCGACRTVAYCSKEHQTTDWPRHKADCKAARKAAASAGAA